MPGIVMFKRRWSVGSDDMVIAAAFLALLHFVWLVVLSAVLAAVRLDDSTQCSLDLRKHAVGYVVILSGCVVIEASIGWLSMRGSILNTRPRDSIQYLLYIRLGVLSVELIWLIIGLVWVIQHYKACPASTAKQAIFGVIVCNWIIMVCVVLAAWCTFDSAGRSWVKLKRQQAGGGSRYEYRGGQRRVVSQRGHRGWRHRIYSVASVEHLNRKAVRMYEESWHRRFRFIFCCMKNERKESFIEVAKMMSDFFVDIDVVPSDIVAGLMLMRRQQKQRQAFVVVQNTQDVYEFLSGVPITPRTRFVNVHDAHTRAWYELVVRYMRYALAAYGWPMYMLSHGSTGVCTILPSLRCCCGCSCGDQPLPLGPMLEDNCCACNFAALLKITGLKQLDISYVTFHVDVDETPFFIALDHEEKAVVLSIRGTQSLKDILTDLKAEAEVLPVEPLNENWLGHKGMVLAAEYIKKKIENERLLEKAFHENVAAGTLAYQLVLVGHSLGAGTAAILAVLLRHRYPNLHCYAFAPPGGLLSATCVTETKSFITSVVVGKDAVPRIGLFQMDALRQDLLNVIKRSTEPKWKIIGGSMVCCRCSDNIAETMATEDAEKIVCWRDYRDSSRSNDTDESRVGPSNHLPLFLPGRIVHVVRNHPASTRRLRALGPPLYQAIWADQADFDEVIISPMMLMDHMPVNMLRMLEKVLTNTGPTKPERSRIVQLDSTQLTPGGADCLDGGASATHSLTWDYAAVGESRRPSSGAGAAPLASPETVSCGSGAEPTRCVSQPQLSNGYGPRSPREGRHSPHSPPRSRRSHSATTPLAHSTPLPPTLRPPGAGNGLNASSVPTIPRLLAATDDATGGDTYRVVSELCLRPPPPPLPVTARLASDM